MNPDVARRSYKAMEPIHSMVYFAPEPQEEYAAIGLDVTGNRASGYFPARAAALGAVGPGLVQATFYNFSARSAAAGMAGVWERLRPQDVLAARFRGVDRALRRLCGDLLDDLDETVALARQACAGAGPDGRPLYAAHAELPWPDEPHLALWHAVTLLREFRGDGHIAVLVEQGVSGLEAAVLHVAVGDSWSRRGLQRTRGYTDQEWDGAVDRLVERGWLTSEATFTAAGRAHRQHVEDRTDVLALPVWEALGEDGAARLRELTQPLTDAVIAHGGFPAAASRT